MKTTKEQLAERLNGREYGSEITREECKEAKESELLVVFGYSDDNCKIRGAFNDEIGCNNGATFRITKSGFVPIPDRDEREVLEKFGVLAQVLDRTGSVQITAVWGGVEGPYSWTYSTDVPHATFEIMEDGEKYCRGIVIDTAVMP